MRFRYCLCAYYDRCVTQKSINNLFEMVKLRCENFEIIPGHAIETHCFESVWFPGHNFPPFCGDGLEHSLCRVVVPFPQVSLHDCQGDQAVQIPSTV